MNNENSLLNALCREGVLISVSVRYWRARKKLAAADLGLDPHKVDGRLISLGHKRLLPKECFKELSLIESRAHALVEASTFPFLNGVARYLPNSKLEEVTARLRQLEAEFNEQRDVFCREYAALRMSALEQWHLQAEELTDDPARLLAVIRSAFPAPADLPRYFGFSIRMFSVAVPDVAQQELLEYGEQIEVIRARQEAARNAQSEIENSCREFIGDCVGTLRSETAKLCEDMLGTINGTGSVHQKTLNRLVKFIDRFKQLNFIGDDDMERQLEEVRQQFLETGAAEYRDSAHSRDRLISGLSALRDEARTLAQQDASELVRNFGQPGRRKFALAA